MENKNWYIVHTYTGFEKFVAESIKERARKYELDSKIGEIIIPMENVVEIKGGKKVVTTKKAYPGYILINMELDDRTWQLVRRTPRVTGFVGSGQKPTPLDENDVKKIVQHMEATAEKPKPRHTLEKGEAVRIIDGPFSNFNGIIDSVNHERGTVKVIVTIFGRQTPVELDFLQVEKL